MAMRATRRIQMLLQMLTLTLIHCLEGKFWAKTFSRFSCVRLINSYQMHYATKQIVL